MEPTLSQNFVMTSPIQILGRRAAKILYFCNLFDGTYGR
ncbi:hypothetical protein ADIWIN_0440 [Winogradskyella psychrotolerans RS-3]|uniref:Uncharacterized protein n=1 Tax=Winogradskyella psychrotolerans RS-3 TaxID=641526 RepID=S7VW82_9FLAO|nr:hypothetical protein ADIWIN_0440 [Winogradskyella psychrotolerans RS-3]